MKLINPSYEILEQGPGLEGIYEAIERAGRTCYKSTRPEGKTAKDFVDMIIASKHYAMLEHSTVYLTIPTDSHSVGAYHHNGTILVSQFEVNPYSKVNYDPDIDDIAYITTNFRVLLESFEEDMDFILGKYLCEPTEFHEKRVTVKFTTSNSIMREFTRHRSQSFAVESTRYCNYSKDRFNNEITFIIPSWMKGAPEGTIEWDGKDPMLIRGNDRLNYLFQIDESVTGAYDTLLAWAECEYRYMFIVKNNLLPPQYAREVLPLATKCDMIMTGFVSDWQHFFRLRTSILAETGKPHPDASALADPLYKEFIDRKMILTD